VFSFQKVTTHITLAISMVLH